MPLGHLLHSTHIILQVLPLATLQLAVQVMTRNMPGRRSFRFTGNPDVARKFEDMPAEERADHTLLVGHVPFGTDRLLGTEALYLTMLRDPVESAIAFYFMVLAAPGHYLHAMVAAGGWSLEDFVGAGRPEIDNPMVRWLNPPPPPGKRLAYGGVTEDMLETARRNLEERYLFGIAERFDESMLLMGLVLSWDDPRYAGLGTPPGARLADSVSPATVERIREINRFDEALYREAVALFERRLAEHVPDLEAALAAYRERNRTRAGTIVVEGEEIELAAPPEAPGAPAREIVWLASYPRSGNTWLRFLLDAYFFAPALHLNDLGRLSMELDWWLLLAREHGLPDRWIVSAGRAYQKRARPEGFPDHLFVKTHFPAAEWHPLIERTRAAVHMVRDPRDVVLSGLNYSELNSGEIVGDPGEYAQRFVAQGGPDHWLDMGYGSWDVHTRSWAERADFPVLTVRYEDFKADTAGQFRRVLEFLGVPIDEGRLQVAVSRSGFERLRSLEVASRATTALPGMLRGDRFFFHKGQSGQSLAHLGEDLEVKLAGRFGEAMARHGYESRT